MYGLFFFLLILGWVFQSMQLWNQLKRTLEEHLPSNQPRHHRQITPAPTQTCGGKGRRLIVKMTPFGLLGLGRPPSCCCWEIGPLSTTASPPAPACFCSISQYICQDCALVWLPSRTLWLRLHVAKHWLCSHSVGRGVSVLGVIAWKSPSFGHFRSDLGSILVRQHVNVVTDASCLSQWEKKSPCAQ